MYTFIPKTVKSWIQFVLIIERGGRRKRQCVIDQFMLKPNNVKNSHLKQLFLYLFFPVFIYIVYIRVFKEN